MKKSSSFTTKDFNFLMMLCFITFDTTATVLSSLTQYTLLQRNFVYTINFSSDTILPKMPSNLFLHGQMWVTGSNMSATAAQEPHYIYHVLPKFYLNPHT